MLDAATIERLAARLDEAERTRSQVTMFTREHPDLSIEDAYAIQRAWTRLQLARGRIVKGHKIGLTSKAMQNAVGVPHQRVTSDAKRSKAVRARDRAA